MLFAYFRSVPDLLKSFEMKFHLRCAGNTPLSARLIQTWPKFDLGEKFTYQNIVITSDPGILFHIFELLAIGDHEIATNDLLLEQDRKTGYIIVNGRCHEVRQ